MAEWEPAPPDLTIDVDAYLEAHKHSDEAYEYVLGVLESLGYTAIWAAEDNPVDWT